MSSHAFYIAYDGPALERNEMAVRDLAPALLALSDAFDEANAIINAGKSEIRLNVKASFKTGCFGIDLVAIQNLKDSILSVFTHSDIATAADIATLLGFPGAPAVGGLILIIKKIRGRKIEKIEIVGERATICIDSEHIQTERRVIEFLRNRRIREALEEAIYVPLNRPGIESFSVTSQSPVEKIIEISAGEHTYFKVPPSEEEIIEEGERETSFQLMGVSFQEGNKWRFSDGAETFYAEVADPDFLAQVNNKSVAFAKGDILKVNIYETTRLTKEGMKTDRKIVKVLSHRHASLQLRLPVIDATPTE